MLEKWINMSHGLELAPDINTAYRQNENGILFLALYLIVKNQTQPITHQEKNTFAKICENLRSFNSDNVTRSKGVFDRGANESRDRASTNQRIISHDNLTAISATSHMLNLPYHKEISHITVTKFNHFDSALPDAPRTFFKGADKKYHFPFQFHPRDFFYWLLTGLTGIPLIAAYPLILTLFPIFFISMVLAANSPKRETSGKQLLTVRLLGRPNLMLNLTWKACNYILKRKYKTYNWLIPVTDIYYPHPEHPIHAVVANLKEEHYN